MRDNIEKVYVIGSLFSTMEKMNWMRVSREFKRKVVWIEKVDQLDTTFRSADAELPVPFYTGAPINPPSLQMQHLGSLWNKEVGQSNIQQWEYLPFSFISALASAVSLKGYLSLHLYP